MGRKEKEDEEYDCRVGKTEDEKETMMTTAMRIPHMLTIVALAMIVGVSANAAITVLNTGSAATDGSGNAGDFSLASGVYSYTFNAGATSDMLVVGVSVEKGGGYGLFLMMAPL